jgi:hypothetical protein
MIRSRMVATRFLVFFSLSLPFVFLMIVSYFIFNYMQAYLHATIADVNSRFNLHIWNTCPWHVPFETFDYLILLHICK